MRRLEVTVLRNSAFGLSAQVVIKVISFIFSIAVIRVLGAGSYGQYMAVGAFGYLFLFISELGLSTYTVREVARYREAEDSDAKIATLWANVLPLRFVLTIIASVLVVAAAWLTQRPLIMIGAIALNTISWFLYAAQGSASAMLSGHERLGVGYFALVLQQVVFIALGTVSLFLALGYYGLIVANLISVALMTIFTVTALRGVMPLRMRPNIRVWPALLRASLPFAVVVFTLGLSYNLDTVLLNIFRGDIETGYYNAAYRLIFTFVVLSNVINTALYPSLSRQSVNGSASLNGIYQRVLTYLLLAALPITFGVFILADQLVPFLFKSGFAPAIPALRILIWVLPLMYVSEFFGYVVLVDNRERNVARAVLISTGINVGINLLLIPRYGYLAASAMTVFTEAVLVAQYCWLLRSRLRHFDLGRVLVRPLFAVAAMCAVLMLSQSLGLLVAVGLGGAVYVGMLVALGLIGRSEVQLVRGLLQPIS